MAKRSSSVAARALAAGLFRDVLAPKHRTLFLPRFLAASADATRWDTPGRAAAHGLIVAWADLAQTAALGHKETALDADFLEKVFGDALGYKSVTESPALFHRQKQFHVPGVGTADGALGMFTPERHNSPTAIIELKDAAVDLDHDKFNGRTPVQQCWDYLNHLPDCPWGIVSNYVTVRLYHRDRTPNAYEQFHFADLRDPDRFARFWYVFQRDGLLGNSQEQPRALALLKQTRERQKEAGNDLYDHYSNQRLALIRHLIDQHKLAYDDAIAAAQKLLDRVIFIAFCADRGLLPDRIITSVVKDVPKFTRATNPVWGNFKLLFGMIDKGDRQLDIPPFNGGLFRADPVVDSLDLSDEWTNFFAALDGYDFRDEVNVDVLGHLFERSITELEKLRVTGFFGPQAGTDGQPEMPKSALRKRFGIYYTPPEFTQLIVDQTLGVLIRQRVEPLESVAEKLAALRAIKIIDPACGSGAFLIAAYERLDLAYGDLVRELRIAGDAPAAAALEREYADHILRDNLYGVDVSGESVEITQLALWIRSARKDKTLADLSRNIVCGNSLVADEAVHERAINWQETFKDIFARGGFDCVIGNPPWERMKLQQREFFALGAPDIASAVSAADRRTLIAAAEHTRPDLFRRFTEAASVAERALAYVRKCKAFPLTARGDVNTYMLFAELARTLVAPTGRVGLLVPSGIATDDTTKHFFSDLIEKQSLVALYDFENKKGLFQDVHRSYKFCILLLTGADVRNQRADFVFFAHQIEDLADKNRQIALSAKDLKLVNPNTRTCPIFRTTRDADLTRAVYRRIPVLIDESRRSGGNPWGVRFTTMFHQTNDAEKFVEAPKLKARGFRLAGNRWIKGKEQYLPLYEAKMMNQFDHRASTVFLKPENWQMQYETSATTLVEHQNPEYVVQPRWWIDAPSVATALHADSANAVERALMVYRNVARSTDSRTMIAAFIPCSGVINSAPLIRFSNAIAERRGACLLGNLNSLAYDFVTRQKIGGINLNFFIVEQLPTLPPDAYDERCPWDKKQKLESWVSERVLRLTCTSDDMRPLAEAAGFKPGVVKWKEPERAELRAELDAAYFRLYGIGDDDIEYILGTFQGVRDEDEAHDGVGPTRQRIRDALRRLS